MYRYSTPTLPLKIKDIDFAEVDFFRVAVSDGDTTHIFVVRPTDENADAEKHIINVALTQQQTAKLAEGEGKVQVRIKFLSGSVLPTEIKGVTIKDVLDEVII